jgi:hypothetical protein
MLVDPVVCGAAYVLEDVFLWPEHSSKAKVSVANGATVQVRGSFDYAASRPRQLGHNTVGELLPMGDAKPDHPFCVVVEVKRGAEMRERFGQILIEMKVVQAATGQSVVNGIYTDGNKYYFLRLEGQNLKMTERFFRPKDLKDIFLLTQVALKGDPFWIEEEKPRHSKKSTTVVRRPDGTRVITTTVPAGMPTPPLPDSPSSRASSFTSEPPSPFADVSPFPVHSAPSRASSFAGHSSSDAESAHPSRTSSFAGQSSTVDSQATELMSESLDFTAIETSLSSLSPSPSPPPSPDHVATLPLSPPPSSPRPSSPFLTDFSPLRKASSSSLSAEEIENPNEQLKPLRAREPTPDSDDDFVHPPSPKRKLKNKSPPRKRANTKDNHN